MTFQIQPSTISAHSLAIYSLIGAGIEARERGREGEESSGQEFYMGIFVS